ncbi:MAG: hypothetical protein QOH50_4735 [Kribbellaceae bacterium]|nr:hypothetical protein [Kribbellaceae bacterium]
MLIVALLALAAVALLVVRPRLKPADWPWRFRADPLPAEIDEAQERAAYQAAHRKVFDAAALEKTFLIGLITVIYGEVLPGVAASSLQLFLGIGVYVVLNSATGLWSAKRGHSWESAAISFAVVFAINIALVALADLLLSRGGGNLRLVDTLFFVFLFSLLTTLYDRYRPAHDYRAAAAAAQTGTAP